MSPRFPSVAVIGAGPSGISAVKALHEENAFQRIALFERRSEPGGIWNLDPIPDAFPTPTSNPPRPDNIPEKPPQLVSPSAEDVTARTAIYDALDSNVGAKAMAFTHTEFPLINSASSTRHLGHSNPTRPFRVVKRYLEDLFKHYLHLASFNTTVVVLRKIGDKWRLTLRQSGHFFDGSPKDYWW